MIESGVKEFKVDVLEKWALYEKILFYIFVESYENFIA